MKSILILLAIFTLGCESTETHNPNQTTGSNEKSYETVVIDSCEYIEYDRGFGDSRVYCICHKGNCKYCLQRIKN